MISVWVAFVLILAMVQLCPVEYVVYGWKMTLDNNLSLNPNRCHHPLITQLNSILLNLQIWILKLWIGSSSIYLAGLLAGQTLRLASSHSCVVSLYSTENESIGSPPVSCGATNLNWIVVAVTLSVTACCKVEGSRASFNSISVKASPWGLMALHV